ncbi:hypothetical protein ANN_24662 [Periplaneta americana]|uniref:Histone-lysine N-methyltransferase SETMAR n=1 Tax=Periplaneta americana TaxID=6978 RepID=A0ABQ8S3W3_PERAM|nr:hypothetical protein ANN_24662 [Periplaneta americana]
MEPARYYMSYRDKTVIAAKDSCLWTSCHTEPPFILTRIWQATLKKIQARLSRVRRHREKQDVLLLHDNTQPYVSHKTTDQIRKFG